MPQRVASLVREFRSAGKSLRQIARAFGRLAPLLAAPGLSNTTQAKNGGMRGRRKPALSAEARRALQLQGRYMGTLRGLKPPQKAQVKRIRAEKGVRAALLAAGRLREI